MAYSELIKNFHRIRAYLRSFYVYGFYHRGEFTQKSARSYDNEKRRVESWLGDYMSFGRDEDGKRVFLSVDSRSMPQNPLYRAFRAKSFTDRDITLHFHILDILKATDGLSITGIMKELDDRLLGFASDEMPDESTVRKKLKEYAALGIVVMQKRGRETFYVLNDDHVNIAVWDAAVAFFSEASPLGVIGSFIQDRMSEKFDKFRFKHHYILHALDSEILYELFSAIIGHRLATFVIRRKHITVLPMKVYVGTQTGRQYLLSWSPTKEIFSFHRVDLMDSVKLGEVCSLPEDLEKQVADFCCHSWGVTGNRHGRLEHIEMMVYVGAEEGHIIERLKREKRCGQVEQVDETHWRFTADVYEGFEMLPWLRTFIGRVSDLQCTDERVVTRFWQDFAEMTQMYGGESNDVS